MNKAFLNIRTQLNEFWQGLTSSQKRKLILATILCISGILVLAVVLGRQQYVILYSGLDIQEAGQITKRLDEMKIPWRTKAGDSVIEVPKGQDAKIRMQLATEGLPKTGGNYDLFLQSSPFGTTDYKEQKLYIFQQQERLQESIKTIRGVEEAIVNISVPENDSFVLKDNQQPATASVLLKLAPGTEMKTAQVKGIQQLVAKSIIGLKPENVIVLDDSANILSTAEDNSDSQVVDQQIDLEKKIQDQLQAKLLSILEPIFGPKKVVVGVAVQLDFDKRSSESVQWQPVVDDEGIVVSIQDLKESMQNAGDGSVPGISNNGANANAGQPTNNNNSTNPIYPEVGNGNSSYDKEQRTINYEVNQLKQQVEEAQGKVKSISISVVVDSDNLDEQVKQQTQQVVAMAAGISDQYVTVQAMPFSISSLQNDINNALQTMQQQKRQDATRNIILGLMAAGVAGVITVGWIMASNRRQKAATEAEAATAIKEMPPIEEIPLEVEDERTQAKRQIDKLIDQKPEVVAQLLRTWLNEE